MRHPRRSILAATVATAGAVAALAVGLDGTEDGISIAVTEPVALAADDASRRSLPSFTGPHADPAYPDATPRAGDPGTYGDEPIGYPVEVVAAAAEAPRAAADPSSAVPASVWDRLATCEANGNWSSSVGLYEGGLQFHPGTWDAYKPAGYPGAAYQASREQQILVAERVLANQGWSAWPACSRKLGLR